MIVCGAMAVDRPVDMSSRYHLPRGEFFIRDAASEPANTFEYKTDETLHAQGNNSLTTGVTMA